MDPTNDHSADHHPKGKSRHGHVHGAVEPALLDSERGIRVVKWSLLALLVTALLQVAVVLFTGSVALLADTIHNLGDALTAIPLWIAFSISRRPPTRRFTYGYGRAEDLAGLAVVLMILLSAFLAGYESIQRLYNPQEIKNLWAVALASIIGFIGNEGVAIYRIRVGKQIASAALIADGYHAATDGLTSLAVLVGAVGVWLGYPLADPIIGLAITVAILKILWDSAKPVFQRLLDGVDPEVLDEIDHTVSHLPEVKGINEVRVRWLGHRMHAELNIAVEPGLSVSQGHDVAVNVQKELLEHLSYLSSATIHVDPKGSLGTEHH